MPVHKHCTQQSHETYRKAKLSNTDYEKVTLQLTIGQSVRRSLRHTKDVTLQLTIGQSVHRSLRPTED